MLTKNNQKVHNEHKCSQLYNTTSYFQVVYISSSLRPALYKTEMSVKMQQLIGLGRVLH